MPDGTSPRRAGRWVVLILTGAIVGWHLYLTRQFDPTSWSSTNTNFDRGAHVSLNPFTDLIGISMQSENHDKNPFAGLGDALVNGIAPGVVANLANVKAREQFDVYAMLVPYAVKVEVNSAPYAAAIPTPASEPSARKQHTPDPDLEKKLDQWRLEREAREAKEKERTDYIASKLKLEDFMVGKGTRFLQEEVGVFGTLVNNGDKTLKKIKLRIFFLDASGRRIGETDYSPVLVSDFAIGDNTPLRPGYRKDFGYSVKDHAPSQWSQRAEAEIIEIEFDG